MRCGILLWFSTISIAASAQWYAGVTPHTPDTLTVLFVGDLMQHQAQIDAAHTAGGYDYNDCFLYVANEIGRADVAIGNLEVTLGGEPYKGYPQFSAPDEYLTAIQQAGITHLLTANNHCLDRRQMGLERTLDQIEAHHIPYAGTYRNAAARDTLYPLIIDQNNMRIAVLNYTYGTNGIAVQQPNVVNYINKGIIADDIERAKEANPDLIIACMHWGNEYEQLPRKGERDMAQWLIGQGVDHVIGNHPHVVQPIEVTTDSVGERHVVAYSLGNYISNMSARHTDGGLMLKMTFVKDDDHTTLVDCAYALVWVSRPTISGNKNFIIYPVDIATQKLNTNEQYRLKLFTNDTRTLFKSHNKGIEEYFFE